MGVIMDIVAIDEVYREQVDGVIKKAWAGPIIVTKGNAIDASKCPGFAAVLDGEMKGCITYHIKGDACEIMTLNSFSENQGIGSALIRAVIDAAKQAGCLRAWLITTNNNTNAIRFFQRFGFSLVAVHLNALDRSRELKPAIPKTGIDEIPLLHEFEFEVRL